MKKWDIYLINFEPSFWREIQKTRPWIIIQSDKIKTNLISIIPISSKIRNKESFDIKINKNSVNRLFSDSVIKIKQISSFDKKRLLHYIWALDKKTINKIYTYLRKHFDL